MSKMLMLLSFSFLAAYTAVNRCCRRWTRPGDFLAAYTAVNVDSFTLKESFDFLAAYTAVN